MRPAQLSHELREGDGSDLERRRWIVGLSLVGVAMGAVVGLYQTGILRRLPSLPSDLFDAERVDASDYAYSRLQTPDGLLMIASYAFTAILAGAGGRDRASDHPILPLALAAKTIYDSYVAIKLGREEWRDNEALCDYCQTATLASLASAGLALPEAVACRAGFDRTGTPHEIWDCERLARRCPLLALTERDWGLYTARGGALFADRIVHDLAALLERRGVALRPNARVDEVDPERATVTLEGGERLGADAVIVAAGSWTGKLLPALAPRLEPRRAVVFYLEPPPDLAAGWEGVPCFLDFGGADDLYLVPPLDGIPLKFGAGSTSYPEAPDAARVLCPEEPERLLACLRPYVRELDRYRVVDHRVCMYCFSPDERFVAGTLANGRLAYATGCSGQMFKFGAVMGEQLAAAATGRLSGQGLARWAVGEVTAAAPA